jgi:erythromycin esterase
MKFLFTFLLIIPLLSFNWNKLQTINLSDSGSKINSNYLKQLDSTFSKVRLIGLGESTHGTSEFTTIRADIFKYLVENHNYTIFFLEADYNACVRVNRYISGSDDNVKDAFREVRLWPWLNQEFLDFVEWMRLYNMNHNNVLEFVGCDMQLIQDDKIELTRLFTTNPKYLEYSSILPTLDIDRKDSLSIQTKKNEWKAFSDSFSRSFPNEESLMIATISQWFENETYYNIKENFRDSCMGNNIADYIEKRPGAKGVYFAHNAHIEKLSTRLLSNIYPIKMAGYFLNERLGNQFFSVALDFRTGSFNALNFKTDKYEMECFTIKRRDWRSLAHYVLGKDNNNPFSGLIKRPEHV